MEKILYVEKELGRCFCCEECIKDYFQPTVEFMEEEFRRLRPPNDFSERQTLRLSHYRQLTLEDPDEIWVDQTETGEHHYTYIARFRNGDECLSFVVICLAIEGIPSFVFLAFPTLEEDLVDEYRRGVELKPAANAAGESSDEDAHSAIDLAAARRERVASASPAREPGGEGSEPDEAHTNPQEELSASERLYLEVRQAGDIPRDQFERFERFVEATIDEPDEIWRFVDPEGNEWCTFITRHTTLGNAGEAVDATDAIDEFTMIVVCEHCHEEAGKAHEAGKEALEVAFAFPTIDPGLVQHFRKGVNSLNKAFGVGWAWGRAA